MTAIDARQSTASTEALCTISHVLDESNKQLSVSSCKMQDKRIPAISTAAPTARNPSTCRHAKKLLVYGLIK